MKWTASDNSELYHQKYATIEDHIRNILEGIQVPTNKRE